MHIVSFDRHQEIPVVNAVVRGPKDFHKVRLVFDTGAGLTQIDTNLIESIGYTPSDGKERLVIRAAAGNDLEGYSINVKSLTIFHKKFSDLRIGVFDFEPFDRYRIHGLLGFDVIKQLHLEVDGPNGALTVH